MHIAQMRMSVNPRSKPAIASLYVAQIERVLSRNTQAAVIVESSDWAASLPTLLVVIEK